MEEVLTIKSIHWDEYPFSLWHVNLSEFLYQLCNNSIFTLHHITMV
ncbi:hypothetical protein HanPI659440_Chr13g0482621 [Helianthus annuus]|nr:hypothetical protein HanPI659440_Chr13g0482621 [Helianthus annuus]